MRLQIVGANIPNNYIRLNIMKAYKKLEQTFEHLHNNPPSAFNPDYDPMAKKWSKLATQSMEKDGFYSNHSRSECAIEWRKRYNQFKAKGV